MAPPDLPRPVPGNPVKTCVAKTPPEIHWRQLTAALQIAKVSLLEANEPTHTELCCHSTNVSIRSSQSVGTSSPLQTTHLDREAMTDSGQRPHSQKMSLVLHRVLVRGKPKLLRYKNSKPPQPINATQTPRNLPIHCRPPAAHRRYPKTSLRSQTLVR